MEIAKRIIVYTMAIAFLSVLLQSVASSYGWCKTPEFGIQNAITPLLLAALIAWRQEKKEKPVLPPEPPQ